MVGLKFTRTGTKVFGKEPRNNSISPHENMAGVPPIVFGPSIVTFEPNTTDVRVARGLALHVTERQPKAVHHHRRIAELRALDHRVVAVAELRAVGDQGHAVVTEVLERQVVGLLTGTGKVGQR